MLVKVELYFLRTHYAILHLKKYIIGVFVELTSDNLWDFRLGWRENKY